MRNLPGVSTFEETEQHSAIFYLGISKVDTLKNQTHLTALIYLLSFRSKMIGRSRIFDMTFLNQIRDPDSDSIR